MQISHRASPTAFELTNDSNSRSSFESRAGNWRCHGEPLISGIVIDSEYASMAGRRNHDKINGRFQ